jgi:hypothetical protein
MCVNGRVIVTTSALYEFESKQELAVLIEIFYGAPHLL